MNRGTCCVENCRKETTPEGLLCREHWDKVPGQIKQEYMHYRLQANYWASWDE